MRIDLNMSRYKNPYDSKPLLVSTALKYTGPSLFVDDRNDKLTMALQYNGWLYFTTPESAPSSTALVMTDLMVPLTTILQHASDELRIILEHLAAILLALAVFVVFVGHVVKFGVTQLKRHQ
jgi:hypothetical protein